MTDQQKNYRSLSFVQVANIVGDISGVAKDVEKAEVLGLSQSDFANRKKRGAIPYDKLIEWALANNYDLNEIFTDRDETWKELPGKPRNTPRGMPTLTSEERKLLDGALEILRAKGQAADFGDTLRHVIKSLKKALDVEKKTSKPRSKKGRAV